MIRSKIFQVFFGNANCHRGEIEEKYETYNLHQVHGNIVVPSQEKLAQADGHFSKKPRQALLIKTADCMPVFLHTKDTAIALHVGWRGLQKRILTEAANALGCLNGAQLFLGPHIEQKSFELDRQNALNLITPHHLSEKECINKNLFLKSDRQRNHYFISLKGILKKEAHSLGITAFNDHSVDTFTSPKHYSYRRNRFQQGRNYSFIIKN